MSQGSDDLYADVGALGGSDGLRPVYERLEADGRAWSATVSDEAGLIAFARSLPRRSSEETMRMQSQPDHPEWETTQCLPYAHPGDQPPQRPSQLRTWLAVVAAMLVVALLGGSFYLLRTSRSNGAPTMPTATTAQATDAPLPTATSAATPLPTAPVSEVTRICGPHMPTEVVVINGLAITPLTGLGNLAYPKIKLPDDAPLAPFQVVSESHVPIISSDRTHPTNPRMRELGGGYTLSICNISTAPHIIQRVDVRLDSVVPYTSQLNQSSECVATYSPGSGVGGTGCGGADYKTEYMHAPFAPDATVGATVTATQVGQTNGGENHGVEKQFSTLPVTLIQGDFITIEVGMGADTGPVFSVSGDYTFSFSLGVDGHAPERVAVSPPTLLTSIAREWTGAACTTPAMQAKFLPGATGEYVCPAS